MIRPPTVLLFFKAPRPGFVKTRLAADLGQERACEIYREMAEKTLNTIPSDWPKTVYYTPCDAEAEMRAWLGKDATFRPQNGNGLGDRLQASCEETFAKVNSGIILLGGDCPQMTKRHLSKCAEYMASDKAVIGPAKDGGYWLLGLPRPCYSAFEKINWSTETVFKETLAALVKENFEVHLLDQLEDVDDLSSYQRNTQVINNSPSNTP